MDEQLTELATSAANALVSAMGTDLWLEAKRLMRAILAHSGRRRTELTAALDQPQPPPATHQPGHAANPADLVRFWSEALAQLLEQNPALAQHARALASIRPLEQPGTLLQLNSATNSGEVFAVQHGTQHIVLGPKAREPEEGS